MGHPPAQGKMFFFQIGDQKVKVLGRDDECVLEVAHNYKLEDHLQGICAKCVVCATCHVYIPDDLVEKIPQPDDMETETLEDQVQDFLLKDTSRLGCQVRVSDIYEGCIITMPYSSFMGKTIYNEDYSEVKSNHSTKLMNDEDSNDLQNQENEDDHQSHREGESVPIKIQHS